MSKNGKWTYSTSEEYFNSGEYFDTKEQAIAFGKAECAEYEGVTKIYVGQVAEVGLGVTVDVDSIMEHINQSMCDDVGEHAEDYLMHTKNEHDNELEAELCDVITKWIKRHGYEPEFFKVINIETVNVA